MSISRSSIEPIATSWATDRQPRGWLAERQEIARNSVGRPDLHLLDLRHTGLTLAAAMGQRSLRYGATDALDELNMGAYVLRQLFAEFQQYLYLEPVA